MSTHPTALDIVGGAAVVGGSAGAGVDLAKLVRRGLPVGAVQFVLDSGVLSAAELDRIVLPRKTLANRRKLGTLTLEQSDRLVRVARVIAAAEETFGSREKAGTWLRRRPVTCYARPGASSVRDGRHRERRECDRDKGGEDRCDRPAGAA